jgi:S-adenosyl-L-methionine hydrolase (adenosine-forming)
MHRRLLADARERNLPRQIITLTTDYGTNDHLVGSMKGVILGINSDAEVVDITHAVAPHDILDAALIINDASRYFPSRTVHVVVVDPGVGTERRPLLVTAGSQYYIAPDNGVLSLIYEREKDALTVRQITAEHYFLQPLSRTFHGRDVFAPVAAWFCKAWQSASFGEEIEDYVRLAVPKPKADGNVTKGIVLRVDTFGNLLTNLTPDEIPALITNDAKVRIKIGNKEINHLSQTFADGAAAEAIALIGSNGALEISVNKGHAAKALGVNRGSEVTVEVG